ncbi:hypothetical protein GCM10011338_00820 [Alteromonas lipolytica]|nr:hypothetical protein GCM10011338_00820 [Alteromonas lipolytica]
MIAKANDFGLDLAINRLHHALTAYRQLTTNRLKGQANTSDQLSGSHDWRHWHLLLQLLQMTN